MDMMMEPLLLFETVLIENRSILEFLDSDYTYRSGRLRKWYGDAERQAGWAGLYAVQAAAGGRSPTGWSDHQRSGAHDEFDPQGKPITRGAWVAV